MLEKSGPRCSSLTVRQTLSSSVYKEKALPMLTAALSVVE
jgi:hypothetical protein